MEESGLPYERVLTDISTGAQKAPDFLKVNPMGKVPALSRRRCRARRGRRDLRLHRRPLSRRRKLAPAVTDPRRARYLQWLFFSPGCIEPAIIQIFTKIEIPTSTAAWGSATQVFDVLEAALAKGPWILGEEFSAADITVGSGLNFAVRLFKMVPSRPAFDAYLARCMARPAFQRAEKIAAG